MKKKCPWVGLEPTKVLYISRAEIEKFFVRFLVQVKIAKSPSEINWPLRFSQRIFSQYSNSSIGTCLFEGMESLLVLFWSKRSNKSSSDKFNSSIAIFFTFLLFSWKLRQIYSVLLETNKCVIDFEVSSLFISGHEIEL